MNKYRAKKTTIDGITFDSKKEAARYAELKLMERGKAIKYLKLQPEFPIEVKDHKGDYVKICTYKADFVYHEGDRLIVEDVKGVRTPVYKLKKKLVEALYGIEIIET